MRRFVFAFVALAAALALGPATAQDRGSGVEGRDGRRVALVIGNGAYRNVGRLPNPHNNAAAMVKLFRDVRFSKVVLKENLGLSELSAALANFEVEARDAEMAVVYFSGHGLELGGQNYLVPTDADITREVDIKYRTLPLERVLEAVAGATKLKLVILDACRSNPFKAVVRTRSVDRGLARVEPPVSNELVAYAARAGTVAQDGEEGTNSPFAAALVRRLGAPGVDIEFALRQVRDDVLEATHREQEPFHYGSLGGFALPLVPTPSPVAGPAPDESTWGFIRGSRDAALFKSFAETYPSSAHAAEARALAERFRVAAVAPPFSPPPVAAPCGGATVASVTSRAPGVLSSDEECALKPKDAFKECAECPTMVVVPAGRFTMGSPDSEEGRNASEGPRHEVTIARPFAVGKFPVTFAEWDACAAAGGCGGYRPEDESWGRGRRPVVNVSWDDAQAYVKWLSEKTGKAYRLLSEAEREYVTRAGTTSAYWWGNSFDDRKALAIAVKTVPVGSYASNPWGLYDVHGNVWEWVEDCWADSYADAPNDGSARTTGDCSRRVLRGGSFDALPHQLRAANRPGSIPDNRDDINGLRVARVVGAPER